MTQTRRQLLPLLALGLSGIASGARAQIVRAQIVRAQADAPENLFISPHGKPFRAPPDAPYPVAAWFRDADKDGDGKLSHDEFLADAAAFFKVLDRRGRGQLSPFDVQYYERVICPEVLGARVDVSAGLVPPARLWLVQRDVPGSPSSNQSLEPGIRNPTPDRRPPPTLDESRQGASPYSFFDEPEPVSAADLEYTGFISEANFMKLADTHFATLDSDHAGYLTLAALPKTPAQRMLEARRPRRGS